MVAILRVREAYLRRFPQARQGWTIGDLHCLSALVLSMFWRKFTTRAAQMSMLVGTASSLILIYLSPTIQIDILKNSEAWFPLRNPGLVTIPLSFVVAVGVSLLWPVPLEEQRFRLAARRLHLGVE